MSNLIAFAKVRGTLAFAAALLAACTTAGPSPAQVPSLTRQTTAPGTGAPSPTTAGAAIDIASLEGRIVFSTGPQYAEAVYIVNADGSGLRRLTRDPLADFDPALSPDGKRIAYRHQDEMDSSNEIFVMNADGSAPRSRRRQRP